MFNWFNLPSDPKDGPANSTIKNVALKIAAIVMIILALAILNMASTAFMYEPKPLKFWDVLYPSLTGSVSSIIIHKGTKHYPQLKYLYYGTIAMTSLTIAFTVYFESKYVFNGTCFISAFITVHPFFFTSTSGKIIILSIPTTSFAVNYLTHFQSPLSHFVSGALISIILSLTFTCQIANNTSKALILALAPLIATTVLPFHETLMPQFKNLFYFSILFSCGGAMSIPLMRPYKWAVIMSPPLYMVFSLYEYYHSEIFSFFVVIIPWMMTAIVLMCFLSESFKNYQDNPIIPLFSSIMFVVSWHYGDTWGGIFQLFAILSQLFFLSFLSVWLTSYLYIKKSPSKARNLIMVGIALLMILALPSIKLYMFCALCTMSVPSMKLHPTNFLPLLLFIVAFSLPVLFPMFT